MVAGLGLALCTLAAAKADNPLERMTPVPKTEPIPVADFFRPSLFSNPEFNAAGTHFFASTTVDFDRREIVVYDIAGKKYQRLYGPGKRDLRNVDWLGDDHLIFALVADNKRTSEGLYVAPVDNLRSAFGVDYRNVDIVLSSPLATPTKPLIWIRQSAFDRGSDCGVVQIDGLCARNNPFAVGSGTYVDPKSVDYGSLAKVICSFPQPKDGDTRGYITNAAGELAYAVTTKDGESVLHRFDGKNWLPCPVDLDEIRIVAVGDQPGKLFVLGPREDGKPRACALGCRTGRGGSRLSGRNRPQRLPRLPAPGRRPIIGLRLTRGSHHGLARSAYRNSSARSRTPRKVAAGCVVSIVGSDRGEKSFLSRSVRTARHGRLHDRHGKGAISPVVPNAARGSSERAAPDDLPQYKNARCRIDGYLTSPRRLKGTPVPLVVLAAWRSWARDSWDATRGQVSPAAVRRLPAQLPRFKRHPVAFP
jgi:hypothetical protein